MLLERADQVGRRQLRRFANIFEPEHLCAMFADEFGGAFQFEIRFAQWLLDGIQS
ncbi:hypothetical protein D3C78_1771560 [compost metagenome]